MAQLSGELATELLNAGNCFVRRFKACRKEPSEKRVHALRIEARRLLAILDLLEHSHETEELSKVRRMAKKKLDWLDDLRDVQVQALALKRLAREFPELKPIHKSLHKREERLGKGVRKKLKAAGSQKLVKRLSSLQSDYARWIGPRPDHASTLIVRSIARAFREVVRLRRAIDPQLTETIHATRIAFKRFRYMLEALPTLRRLSGPRRLARMRHYQTSMGNIQDMEILLGRLKEFSERKKRVRVILSPIMPELARRHALLIQQYMAIADELYSFWIPKPK